MANLTNEGMLAKAIIEIRDEKIESVKTVAANGRMQSAKSSGGKTYRFAVQFNPSELEISSRGKPCTEIVASVAANRRESENRYDIDTETTLKFKLIFDSTDNRDAFLYETAAADSTGSLTGNLAANPSSFYQLTHKSSAKTLTVQYKVEGFLAALMLGKRKMTFSWGNMSYSGVLDSVSGQYTMFNPIGHPIRAEIDIEMICDAPDTKGSMGQWESQYTEFFN